MRVWCYSMWFCWISWNSWIIIAVLRDWNYSGTFHISVTEFLECGVRCRGIATTFPELIDSVELWILLSFLIERVQFLCLGSAMTKCLFSATHKIILNSCTVRVTLLQWIDNFCDFEIRMLQILVCWAYFLLFQNFTEEQFKTYKVSCYVKTLNQSMRCLNFKIIKVNCDELTTAILSRGIPRTRVLTHSTTISATCLMSKYIDEMYNGDNLWHDPWSIMWVHALNMDKLRVARVEFSSMCCISGAGQSTGACCGSGEQVGEILEKCQLDKFLLTQLISAFTVQVWIMLGALLYWFLFICFSYKNRSLH